MDMVDLIVDLIVFIECRGCTEAIFVPVLEAHSEIQHIVT